MGRPLRSQLLDGVCRDDELRTELLSAMVSIRRYYVGNDAIESRR